MSKVKFTDLPLSATFNFQGTTYTKTSPILASSADGGQRMVPRSALVECEADLAANPTPQTANKLDALMVTKAFEEFYGACLDHLSEAGIPDENTLRVSIRQERDKFMAVIMGPLKG